jgi:hypothetical protein
MLDLAQVLEEEGSSFDRSLRVEATKMHVPIPLARIALVAVLTSTFGPASS